MRSITWTTYVSNYERFTCGDCHILAAELSKRTGWPICTFTDSEGRPDMHAFVMRPDGQCLDVEGLAPEVEFRQRWGAPMERIQTFDTLEDLHSADERWKYVEYGNISYALAGRTANHLVSQYAS